MLSSRTKTINNQKITVFPLFEYKGFRLSEVDNLFNIRARPNSVKLVRDGDVNLFAWI
ncbi:MAG: hypothetical protein WBA07_27195 [Rivularia sp. (in: cyanobacteria)]